VPPITDDLGSWAALLGILLPVVVALLQKENWSPTLNAALFGVACVIASAIYGWIKFGSNFTWAHWEATLLAIIVWGLATYHTYWKQGGTQSIVAKARRFPAKAP
jgi:uncharacterized membrane protein